MSNGLLICLDRSKASLCPYSALKLTTTTDRGIDDILDDVHKPFLLSRPLEI